MGELTFLLNSTVTMISTMLDKTIGNRSETEKRARQKASLIPRLFNTYTQKKT